MSKLYTITFVTSVEVTTPDGQRMKDTIQTFYDVNEKQIVTYQAKFPGVDVSLEEQRGVTGKMPKIDFGERYVPAPRTPIKWWAEREGAISYPARPKRELPTPPLAKSYENIAGSDYAAVVNELMKDNAA